MSRNSLLVVHPDASTRSLIASMLRSLGHGIEEADCDRAALRLVEASPPSLVLAGVDPADADAMEMLDYMKRKHPGVPIVLLFAEPHPDRAREAMRRGAASVLRFPTAANNLRAAVSQAIEERARPVEIRANGPSPVARLADGPGATNGHHADGRASSNGHSANGHAANGHAANGQHVDVSPPAQAANRPPSRGGASTSLVGQDSAFRQAIESAGSIAPGRVPVLIVGERGTGKTTLARAIHALGERSGGPFVEVACSSQAEAALEAELFGQEGAGGSIRGKLSEADGGSIHLDEVASLPPSIQLRLLKWIQDGEYLPRGSIRPIRVDVRLIASTREDLTGLAEEGSFRQDLHHRIGVVSLKLPPLRLRGSDTEVLADHFRLKYAGEVGKEVLGFTIEAIEALRAYNWPGNVLELENAVERGVVLCRGGRIEAGHLALPRRSATIRPQDRQSTGSGPVTSGIIPLKEALEAPERLLILQALEALSWNRQETARVLDINRTTLYKKMKKYGLLVEEPAWVH